MMDVVQVFNDELQSLVDMKPPVSKAKMGQITRAAMKGVKFYKHIVKGVEKFIYRCGPEYKVPGLYVIDSIVRQSRHQFGPDRDVYASRFSNNLDSTFQSLFSGCLPDDRPKIIRVLNLWQKNGVFESHVIQPLLDMGSPSTGLQMEPKSPSSVDENSLKQGQASKYSHQYNSGTTSGSGTNRHDGGLRFTKNMLDFDYDEDDDDGNDETPTEAEPPLSSTLSKIEMEQRAKRADLSNNNNSYQSSQKNLNSEKYHTPQRPQQDPVLERWNRLLRQQSGKISPGEPVSPIDSRRRSRSRSPPSEQVTFSSQQTSTSRAALFTSNRQAAQQSTPIFKNYSAQEAERLAERERKCLPKIRDKHLTVCSSTLWLGHVPKMVSEADISDAFGEFGTINSIDLIPPRGCAYVCMDRRQDAKRALNESRNVKLKGSQIKLAWAPGKGFKEYKKLKDFWEADIGASFIPYSKIDDSIDFETLEEGGVIDEDSMSLEMRERREKKTNQQTQGSQEKEAPKPAPGLSRPLPVLSMLNQPPPTRPNTQPMSVPPPTMSIPPPTMSLPPPTMSIPPPLALSQGMIPFPPPNVMTTAASGGQIFAPPPTFQSTNIKLDGTKTDNDHSRATDGANKSPQSSIDQQLSMTERQISMVEQQLSMIQHAQGMAPLPPLGSGPGLPPQMMLYPQNQPNPTFFDMPAPGHLLHPGQPMLDPQHMAMFMNPMHMLAQQPMMQMNSMGMLGPSEMDSMAQNQRL